MRGLVFVGTLLVSTPALAQPEIITSDGEEDDASIMLTMRDQLIRYDPLVWCEIEVQVGTTFVDFTAGDIVDVYLIEDDAFFNDTVWQDQHVITAEEADDGAYEETFDCNAMGSRDGVGTLEFFAQVDVTKDLCGITCLNDNPYTDNLIVEAVEDDEAEEDDAPGQADEAVLDVQASRIAADADYQRVLLQEPSSIYVEVRFMTACGEVEVEIVDEDQNVVGVGEPGDDVANAAAEGLAPGAYFVVTRPAGANLNFYDITIGTEPDPDATTGGDETGGDSDTNGDATAGDSDSASDSDPSGGDSNSGPGSDGDGSASDPSEGDGGSDDEGDTDSDSTAGNEGQDASANGCGCSQDRSKGAPLSLALLLLVTPRRSRRGVTRAHAAARTRTSSGAPRSARRR
jgi:hypothetical protein